MKSISISYFALLREEARIDQESMNVTFENYRELYDFLKNKYSFSLNEDMIQVAVNEEFSKMDAPLLEGAHIVFIPPVAGG